MIKNLLAICAVLLLSSNFCFAQPTMTNFTIVSDSCGGGNPGYQISAGTQLQNAVTGTTGTIFWGDGSSSTAVIVQGTLGYFYGTHTYTSSGTYTVKAIVYNPASNPTDSSTVMISAFCNSLYGCLYLRNDANCTYDGLVDGRITVPLDIEVRKNNVPLDTFTSCGAYHYSIPGADIVSEYSFHPLPTGNAYQLVCPTIPYKVRLDTLYSIVPHSYDFGYICNASFTGFNMYVYVHTLLRITNTSYLNINAGNIACTPNNGILTLNISPKYSFVSASVPPTTTSGNTLTWNLNNLSGTNTANINIDLNPVGTLTAGDTAINTVSITPTSGDLNTANNTYIATDSIRAAFDPNDKNVLPLGNITAGQLLTYTINFENLGNDTAFNIHIIDTLSNNLDMSTFRLIHSSHAAGVNFTTAGIHKIARFDFNDIKLADKNHPESNKGYIMYQVKAKNSLVPGNEVRNTAHIYFDINPAVTTNTTVSKIPVPSRLEYVNANDKISIYPNPIKDEINLTWKDADGKPATIELINATGQKLIAESFNWKEQNQKISTSSLAPGMYWISVRNERGVIIHKQTIVKQ